MGTLGTFDSFTTARLGIYAAQHGLRVTGNNISNINTAGYTRQRIDQVSLKTGGSDMYYSMLDNHVGNGALVTGISQIRDPYLDIRFRNVSSDVGYTDTMLGGLQQIASILDEVGKGENKGDGLLYAQLQDLYKSLSAIGADPSKDNDTLARTSADALVRLFNTYATKLETLRQNTDTGFRQDLTTVNEILTNIRDLNENIRESEVHGDNALEMRDERNRQIDELSKYMHINVVYSMEDIGAGKQVEKLTISLGNANPDSMVTTDSSVLIDGIYGAQLSIRQEPMPNPNFDATKAAGPDNPRYWNDEKGVAVENAEDATLMESPNYNLDVSKLYDSKGREWKSITTSWEPAADGVVATKARYQFTISDSKDWDAGDKLTIDGVEYTIGEKSSVAGQTISESTANDAVKLASFIKDVLSQSDNYKDYTVSAKNGTISFVAKTAGVVGLNADGTDAGSGPDAAPPAPIGATNDLIIVDKDNNVITDLTPQEVRAGAEEEEPTPPDPNPAIDPDTHAETYVSFVIQDGKWWQATTVTQRSSVVQLDDNDLYGSLQATRELLTEAGEFTLQETVNTVDENAATKRGIPYYQRSLDLLAQQVAAQYNRLNQGYMVNQDGNYIDGNGKELTINDEPVSKTKGLTDGQKEKLEAAGLTLDQWLENSSKLDPGAKKAEGAGVLFSNRGDNNDPSGITASNISISANWSNGDVHIVPTFIQLFGEDGKPIPNTTQSENVNHMITLINESLVYDPRSLVADATGTKLFEGSFNDMFSNMMTVQGNDARTTNIQLNTHYTSQVELDSSRDGVSGVDLNDEAMNMMQFQKAYSAACRLMTAIDEVLDRLINNTGIAGR